MSEHKIRAFLQRNPHPHRIRTDSGELIVLQGRNKWAEAMSAIEALQPSTLEAMDKDGNIMRSLQLEGGGGGGPGGARVEDQLSVIARILSESNDKAAARHEAAYRTAFAAVLELTKTVSARLTNMERAYMALVHRHAETIEQQALGEETDDLQGLATQFLLAKMTSEPADKPKANGKAEPKGD